ncbi:Hpt domain-containing protein [Aliisedimentitalea scapharcae]|uniref:Hpt domain-containing protein n=1 Tax=Aliisedimentitalea scapharcae TaxID=1524259 RepID=A0ABZ2XT13_9RHOB|nr:Hpt domain-containing protein [Rhodobacteraceae bacterium M382]
MIHWARISELREEVGAEDFEEIIEIFLEEVEEVIGRLKQGADLHSLEQDLHFLKGSALNLGFEGFSKLCQDGETQSAQGQATNVDLQSILATYEESKGQFMTELPAKFG